MTVEIERKFIPSLREGIDMVRIIFFKRMKEYLAPKYQDEDPSYGSMLAAAVMNELFAMPNLEERFVDFALENKERINHEMLQVPEVCDDLLILLTDALRMHFLCNHQEGLEDNGEEMLKRASQWGILQEDRDVPLPKGFMELVHRVGTAQGLLA